MLQRAPQQEARDQRLADAAAAREGAAANQAGARRADEAAQKAVVGRSANASQLLEFRRDSAGARATEERRQRATPPPAAAAVPPAAAVSSGVAPSALALAEAVETWQIVSEPEAERITARQVLIVPGLPVLNVGVTRIEGRYVTRTQQGLPDGNVLEIVQEPAAVRGQAQRAEERSSMAAQPVRELAKDELGATVLRVTRGEWLLTGRAILPQDSLRALLERVR